MYICWETQICKIMPITVEKALKKSKNNRNLVEPSGKKKNNKPLIVGALALIGVFVAFRLFKGNNEKISPADT